MNPKTSSIWARWNVDPSGCSFHSEHTGCSRVSAVTLFSAKWVKGSMMGKRTAQIRRESCKSTDTRALQRDDLVVERRFFAHAETWPSSLPEESLFALRFCSLLKRLSCDQFKCVTLSWICFSSNLLELWLTHAIILKLDVPKVKQLKYRKATDCTDFNHYFYY